jgi:hypothetical protein
MITQAGASGFSELKKAGKEQSLRVRRSFNNVMAGRIFQIRRRVKLDTQQLRTKTIRQLEQLFDFASAIARGQVQYQRLEGKMHLITLKERQGWTRVAGYIAQILQNIGKGFDEKQVDEDLAELEKFVNETIPENQAKTGEDAVEGSPSK